MRAVMSSRGRPYVAALLASIVAFPSSAFAQTAPAPAASSMPAPAASTAPAAAATISGIVRGGSGSTIAGAAVTISGPTTLVVTSDAKGSFTATVQPGIYSVTVRKNGFNAASLSDVVATTGTSVPLNVSLSQADLTSLRTIGQVSSTTRGGGSSINTGAATSSYASAQTFANLAAPQVNDVLQRLPDVTIQHMGDEPDTTIIVGGGQPYETQILMDGHPITVGQNGAWSSQYFPSYLIGGVETQSGPGNTTPFANIAVGGTANFVTPAFTQKPTAELVYGTDSYASQYSNFTGTGSLGKVQYVVVAGTGGLNGPYYERNPLCDVNTSAPNLPGQTSIIQYCGDASGSLLTRGEVFKLRYNFTPTTSFEAGFTGAWGEFSPQGAAWGTYDGPTTIVNCFAGENECTNPQFKQYVGQTITGYTWYPGSFVYNNQELFNAQFRTALGSNTFLARPYVGDIEPEIVDGTYEGQYAEFFSPNSSYPGTQIPSTGLPNPNAFENSTYGACPTGSLSSYSQINSPQNTIVTVDGEEECYQYPYTTFEHDKLYGSTFSFIHPFGDNFLNFTYDFHGQSTTAFVNNPENITVPFSTDRYSTFSLTSELHPINKLAVDVGLYDTIWSVSGVQPLYVDGAPAVDSSGNTILTGLDRHVSRFDPHVATTYRLNTDTSLRAAWGTSATFPFVGQVSGLSSFTPYAPSSPLYTAGSLTEKNPSLDPEVSLAYTLGADHRFRNGSVFSIDLSDTIVHNVFQQLEIAETVPNSPECFAQPCILNLALPVNVARLQTQLASVRYRYEPRVGFGFNFAVAATRSILSGLPESFYAAGGANPTLPVNGAQICGNGQSVGIATCIPYLKGYGQFTYTTHGGTYFGLGVDYEGKNNSYLQPPLGIVDFTFRHPITRSAEFLVSVQNLLNTNNYENLPEPNGGPAIVAENSTGLTSYTTTLVPAPPRTVRVQLRLHVGR